MGLEVTKRSTLYQYVLFCLVSLFLAINCGSAQADDRWEHRSDNTTNSTCFTSVPFNSLGGGKFGLIKAVADRGEFTAFVFTLKNLRLFHNEKFLDRTARVWMDGIKVFDTGLQGTRENNGVAFVFPIPFPEALEQIKQGSKLLIKVAATGDISVNLSGSQKAILRWQDCVSDRR